MAEVLGEVSEWPKEHAWKACKPQGFEGSNPSLTAIYSKKTAHVAVFLCLIFMCEVTGLALNIHRQLHPALL